MSGRLAVVIGCWVALPAGGCFDPDVPVGLPCTADLRCPDGQVCDPNTKTCELPSADQLWRDDLAADFAQPGAVLDDAVIESPGAIGPTPYLTGGLRLYGTATRRFQTEGGATWDAIATAIPSGRGFLRSSEFDVGNDRPLGVGLLADDDVTVWFEGEVFLEAGAWGFLLEASDLGFVDLDTGAGFERLALASDADDGFVKRDVAADGWYPIRGAVVDAADDLYLVLQGRPPDSADLDPLEGERLRSRVDDLAGLALDGFDRSYALTPTATTLATRSLGAAVFDDDLDLGQGDWSLRWTGQVRIDVAGAYELRFESHGGHRVWFDGVELIDDRNSEPAVNQTPPLDLAPGWHDLAIDLNWDDSAPPRLAMTVASGPDLVGAGFPVDRTRPVTSRDLRWANGMNDTPLPIPDAMAATRSVWVDVPPGGEPLGVELRYDVTHAALSTLRVVLDPPAAPPITVRAPGSLTGTGSHSEHRGYGPTIGGRGTWSLDVTDTQAVIDGAIGTLDGLDLTVDYAGGVAPFPTTATFTSAPRDLGAVTSLGALRWSLRQAETGGAVVRFRTCDAASACDAEPWTAVESGAIPAVTPRRFGQYQIELTGDGDVPTALDWIELAYRAR